MRKLLVALFLLVSSASLFITSPVQASTQDFKIQSFEADYYLNRNAEQTSLLEVKESIVAVFPSHDQNHGILRAIPKSYQDHTVSLDVKSVTDQTGKPYPFSTTNESGNLVLKIGDADKYVHGVVTYNINYSMRNVINFQKLDEFYWDVNGDQWPQAMDRVVGRLHIPMALADSLSGNQTCYSGTFGSTDKNCTIGDSTSNEEVMYTATATSLGGNQNLSMVVGFKAGTFKLGPEIAQEKRNRIMTFLAVTFITLLLPLVTFIVCFRKWWLQGRDPKGRGVIVAEYVAPKHLNVLSSAYLLNMNFTPKASSAGIIELAVKGYLRLSEITKKKFIGKSTDYQIEVVKDPAGLSKEQELLLDALFDGGLRVGSTTTISDQKNKLFSTIKKLNDHFGTTLTQHGYFATDPNKARKRFIVSGVIMLVIGFMLLFLLPIGLGLLLSAAIVFVFNALMPARTAKGVEAKDYLLGLKEYIKMAEADRIKYLQSPQGVEKKHIDPNSPKQAIKLFEDLLPYAILFGLEEDWAKQFKDLYNQPPDWYNGNSNSFNAVYLAHSLGGFSSANNAAFTAPSSSGSSGFGGGSSGGGGGGGGGGGW